MNVSSRKTHNTNPSFKREYSYNTHQPSPAIAQDGGMNIVPGANTLPLTTGGSASIPSAANNISQHSASYLPGSSLPAPGPHIQTASYHIAHGSASSSQPTLLTSHTQGPPPSSTPPTVPNETKGPGPYQSYPHAMNQHHYRGMPYNASLMTNSNTTRAHNPPRLPQHAVSRNVYINSINAAGHPLPPNSYVSMVPNAMSGVNAGTALQAPNYSLTGSTGGEHGLVFMPANPYGYYTGMRTSAWSATPTARTTPQNVVSVGPTNPIMQNSQAYISVNQVAPLPQQVQQPIVPVTSNLKPRTKNVIPILNPDTGEIVNKDEVENNNNNNNAQKNNISDIKRAPESSSANFSSPPTTSSTFVASRNQTESVLNGSPANVAAISSAADNYKVASQSTAAVTSSGPVVNDVANTLKSTPTFAPSSAQSTAKIDIKKPPTVAAKEDPSVASFDAQSADESKLRAGDKAPSTPVWPETPASASFIASAPAVSGSRAAPAGAKKSLVKDTADPVSAASPPAPTVQTCAAVPGDGVNKTTIVTTPAAVGSDESVTTGQKKAHEATQSVPKFATVAAGKATPFIPASQPTLPETTANTTSIGGPSSIVAQNSAAKADAKPRPSIPQSQPSVAPAGQLSSSGASAIAGVKPPASAIPTSGLISEKSASLTAATTPPASSESSAAASTKSTVGGGSGGSNAVQSAAAAEKSSKDDKTSPPPMKSKNRGGNQSCDSNANTNDHSSANMKGKTAQAVLKHHGADAATTKPSGSTSPPNAVSAKTNGDSSEQSNSSEGKTKKKKSSTKKELNKKGQEKEGSDMDIFTKIEPPTTLPEKSARVEKTPQSNTPQPLTNNVNANNRQKNSSQSTKTESVTPVNFIEKDKSIPSNIPHSVTPPLPPRIADSIKTDKTENTALDKDANLAQKKYSVDFLLSMRDLPQCKERVNVQYPPVMASQDRSGPRGMSQNGFAPAGNSFLPQFMNPGNNMSLPPRKSQQGSMRRDNKPNPIHVSYSLREETPLRVSENAWRPKVLDDKSDEGSKTEALYKTARGLLNKLTPEKFPVIMEKFKGLHIDSNERLKGVIDLIFEKAVDEPGFCKWYAEMCSNMQEFNVAGEKDTKQSFRALLLNKCQSHFESTKADELDADKARVEMEMCTDPEKKKELRIVFEEKERKARRKNVGNCRFIGELFKFKMLTPKIMLNCIRVLISQLEEESLECLCKLLTTIGRDLDDKLPKEVDQFFKRLQDIADPKKKEKISSRIRFMILDVIDLRKNRWVPRRETDNPKTIDQMNMEMEKKEHEQRLANMTMRKSYDDYSRNRDSRKNRNDNQSEDSNWKVVTNRNSVAKINYKYDASKIASITAADTEGPSLGRPQTGTSWRLGAAGGAKKPTAPAVMDSSKSSSLSGFKNASGGKLTPSSSMERPKPNLPIRDDDTNKMSRSGSVQSVHPASREGSMQRTVPSRNASQTAPVPTPAPPTSVPLSDTQIALFSDTIFKEYVSNQSAKDTVDDFEDRFKHKDDREKAIVKFVEYALEKPAHIPACSKIVTVLLQANAVTVPTVANAASFLLEIGDDMKVDYPKFYEWMANILVGWPLLDKDCHLYNELKTALQRLPKNPDLEYLLQEIEKARRNDKDLIIEFLSKSIVINNNHDNVFKWINENVENPHNNPNLVKALTEAVCESLLAKKSKLEEVSEKFGKYFKKYIDNKETLELICLNTIVDFSRRKEHPQGLLLAMFEGLYDSKALSSDSYLQLRKNGKVEELGVAMMNLKNFYDYLENPETDE